MTSGAHDAPVDAGLRIRLQRPSFPSAAAIESYLAASRAEHWYSNFGPCWRLLRSRLTEAAGRPSVPVANATLGLILAIAALRRKTPEAEEALLPAFAHPASAQAAAWNGLEPVFVDVSRDHWHLDPEMLESALAGRGKRVAVVVALSAFGTPPAPDVRVRWEAACAEARVPLVVDSAAGFGAVASDGVPIGGQGDAEVVSFDAVKPLGAGEGGAVFCRDTEIAEEIAALAHFAFDASRSARRIDGINAKMSEPAAAIALAALDTLDAGLAARRSVAGRLLDELPAGFAPQLGHAACTWQFVPVASPDAGTREAVLSRAARGGVELRTYYDPLHEMAAFDRCSRVDDLTVTRDLGRRMLSLPVAVDLVDEEIEAIAAVLRSSDRDAHAVTPRRGGARTR